jgi:imidazole glycerol-phosphate synthase subunit HisH
VTSDLRPSIAIVDYGMGNRRSVEKALVRVGADATITGDHDAIRAADAVVLPGVGAFPKGMANLRERGLDELMRERAASGTPFLGICLGMQLLFESSSELGAQTPGIGLIAGHVRELQAEGLRVPHIGWNEVRFEQESALTADLPQGGCPFYHVHSFVAADIDRADLIGSADYGERFPTIVAKANVYGTQFHPEKSSRHGLLLLSAFAQLARRHASAAVNVV